MYRRESDLLTSPYWIQHELYIYPIFRVISGVISGVVDGQQLRYQSIIFIPPWVWEGRKGGEGGREGGREVTVGWNMYIADITTLFSQAVQGSIIDRKVFNWKIFVCKIFVTLACTGSAVLFLDVRY